jgi:SAM-dependent methyltransferase
MNRADWDERHGDDTRRWSGEASRILVAEAADLEPGRALDLACGQGRNAAWLAELGWRVTAVDFSQVAIEKARARAVERGVEVEWVHADLLEFEPRPSAYGLVLVFYLHVPLADRRAVLRSAMRALAPGGTFLLVGHDRSNLERGHGGPHDPAVLYTSTDIVADLPGLEIERAAVVERPVQTDEGERIALDVLVRARKPVTASGS